MGGSASIARSDPLKPRSAAAGAASRQPLVVAHGLGTHSLQAAAVEAAREAAGEEAAAMEAELQVRLADAEAAADEVSHTHHAVHHTQRARPAMQ